MGSGDDDYFSAAIPTEDNGIHPHPLKSSFGKLPVPTLALFSSADAAYQKGDIKEKLAKWESLSNGKLTTKYIEGASHDVVEEAAQVVLCREVLDWFKLVGL
jgi:alpha-beta hydrolase superfamily lysophospholipase